MEIYEIYVAKISMRSMQDSIKEIDENHAIYTIKYLEHKLICDFESMQFLDLIIVEEDKLIMITLNDNIENN
jgi:transcription elongation factor SPT6